MIDDKYEVVGKKIGEGGFGKVFRLKEKRTGNMFALKALTKSGRDERSGKDVQGVERSGAPQHKQHNTPQNTHQPHRTGNQSVQVRPTRTTVNRARARAQCNMKAFAVALSPLLLPACCSRRPPCEPYALFPNDSGHAHLCAQT